MADAVKFSDIMAHLVSRLNTDLPIHGQTGVRVSVQSDDSNLQVILRRDGGSRRSKTITTTVVGVNIYAPTYAQAESLSLIVEAIFDDLADGEPIVGTAQQASIQDVSDFKAQRRFMRFAVDHRGTNL
jgi:hypothetical protein